MALSVIEWVKALKKEHFMTALDFKTLVFCTRINDDGYLLFCILALTLSFSQRQLIGTSVLESSFKRKRAMVIAIYNILLTSGGKKRYKVNGKEAGHL